MKSQTSLIASQCRLQQWAKQIHDCQNRPADMQVSEWCEMNGITIKYKEGPARYGICESTFIKRAKEAGAVIKLGKSVLVDVDIFEKYLDSFRLPPE